MKIKAQKINEIFYFTYLIQSKAWINTKFSGLKTLSIFDPIFFTFNRPKKDLYVWSRMNERSFIWLMSAEDRHIWISCLHVDLNYWKQSPDVKNWLTGKDPDAGKDWGQEEKWTTEDEMAGWHHWLDGWVWVNSWSWWWPGRPGVLQSMGSQRVRHNWVTELNWIPTILINVS